MSPLAGWRNRMSFSSSYQIPPSARIILNRNGIPPAVAAVLLAESKSVMCSIRGNDSDKLPSAQRLRSPSCPKAGSIQAKSCIIGPAASFVTVDPDFSKPTIDSQGKISPTPRKEGDLPDDQPTLVLNASLQEMIAKIQSKEYEIIEAEEGRLIFKVTENNESPDLIKDTLYQINLNPKNGIPPETIENPEAIGLETASALEKPIWWKNDELGNYDLVANFSFPVQYKKSNIDIFKDFMIAGDIYNGKVLPVIGDIDQFILGFNYQYWNDLIGKIPSSNVQIHAMKDDAMGIYQLQEERLKIETYLLEQEMQLGDNIDPTKNVKLKEKLRAIEVNLEKREFVKGVITPLESYYSDKMNGNFAKDIPHIRNFFKHASEARNPYTPSKIGTVVFFVDGEVHEIKGEKNIADFLLKKVLPAFQFDIHPEWNMEFFSPVVEKQKELGHRILENIDQKYQAWKQSNPSENSKSRGYIINPPEDDYRKLREISASKELAENNNTDKQTETPSHTTKRRI